MDLRGYKLPADIRDVLEGDREKNVAWYQPFIFTDQIMVGTGAAWNSGGRVRKYVCTEADPPEIQKIFYTENKRLGDWYQELVQMVNECFPDANSFIDIGCNTGHFSFDLARRGHQATGVDVFRKCYDIVSSVSGIEFEYIQGRYSSSTHTVPELADREFDFTIAFAISVHLTDPHYFLAYASQLSRQGMLVSSPVVPFAEPVLRHRVTARRRSLPMPERFEFLPSPSAMEIMLQSVYRWVYRRPFVASDPRNTNLWGVWVCSHQEIPAAKLKKFGLEPTVDRISQFADSAEGVCSLPTITLGNE